MEIIGAGFGRTGTLSLKAALERLGVGPCFHMAEFMAKQQHVDEWAAAARGERVNWTEVFDGWGSTVDWPACEFYAQMMEDFPEAKVLLSVRDPERWYASVGKTIHPASQSMRRELDADPGATHVWGLPREVAETMLALVWEGAHSTFKGRFTDKAYALEVLEQHIEEIRATVPADRLLVYEVAEGWGPLAHFIGAEVPDEPFPRLNDSDAFHDNFNPDVNSTAAAAEA